MADRVTLKTDSGKWSYRTTLDDPLFADVLGPLHEIDENLREVVFAGSTADILEEDWQHYIAFHRWRNTVSIKGDSDTLETRAMAEILRQGGSSPTNAVKLHEIARIARIVNLPDNWPLSVAVTDETPEEARVQHLLDMGRAVIESGSESYWDGVSEANFDHYPFAARVLYLILEYSKRILPLGEERAESFSSVKSLVYGAMRNALLLDSLKWTAVNWSDVKRGLDRLGLADSMTTSICDLLAGTPSLHYSTNVLAFYAGMSIEWEVDTNSRYQSISMRSEVERVDVLYDRLLSSYPSDVDPYLLGLAPILSDVLFDKNSVQPISNLPGLPAMVAWVNFNTLLFPASSVGSYRISRDAVGAVKFGGRLREKDFYTVIERMKSTVVGIAGLQLIRSSLATQTKNKRVDHFLRVLEEVLEEEDEEASDGADEEQEEDGEVDEEEQGEADEEEQDESDDMDEEEQDERSLPSLYLD